MSSIKNAFEGDIRTLVHPPILTPQRGKISKVVRQPPQGEEGEALFSIKY